ncbi:hypothetical protein ACEZDB_00530 [Streptacidiphilus sp. N1-3]|uniref:Uncharacterized protein n=1 Tax=Streptacidiphilus alkalitolerans TaxID=3342712 RepID=A0ABV6WSZ3_9ACTN
MARPQGWEWLDDLPDEWEAPSDLQIPTPYPEVNLAIRLLSCDFLGFEVRAAIGRFVTQEALYDIWFLENFEAAGWGMKKAAQLREVPMEQTRIVYEAWKVLDSINGLEAPNNILRERRVIAIAALKTALEESTKKFIHIRSDNSPAN